MGERRPRFLVVGGGRMGRAMVEGWVAAEALLGAKPQPSDFTVVDPGEDKRRAFHDDLGVDTAASVEPGFEADVVVLAVKPQVAAGVLEDLAAKGVGKGALFVSVIAGLPARRIAELLGGDVRVVRTMPNTPLAVGRGCVLVAAGPHATREDLDAVLELFSALGFAAEIDEQLIDAASAISGSGPAYVAALVEHLAAAGEALGLSAELSAKLARETLIGTAELLDATGMEASALREGVSSPGGTTLAALASMDSEDVSGVYRRGCEAAVARARELGEL